MRHAFPIALASLLTATLVSVPASAAPPREASIAFADHGTIDDWRADGTQALYIKGIGRQWYHARLIGPCNDLPFAQAIGIDTGGGAGGFDRFSAIVVRGQRCQLTSLVKSAPPPRKAKHG